MFDWVQVLIDFLAERLDAMLNALNPMYWVNSIATYVASLLPAPDPRIAAIVETAVAAVDTLVYYVSFADFLINLPVYLVVAGICLAAEAIYNIIRAWRVVRSFIT